MILLLLACATEAPPTSPLAEPPADPSAPGPKVDTMLGQVPGVKYLGDWTNTGCPGRSYARNLTFFDGGEFAGVDLVAPCPPGNDCAWSGLSGYAGIWKQEGDKIFLREIGAPIAPGSPHPTEVVADFEGRLVENHCVYERGLTVPEGYTEDQVRPRIPGK